MSMPGKQKRRFWAVVNNAESLPRIGKIFRDIANDPASVMALGSTFMSAAQGGIEGAWLNGACFLGVASLRGYESWTDKEKGRPFAALAAVNLGTAVSIAYHGYQEHGLSEGFARQASMSLAYTFWSVRSSLLSWQGFRGTQTTKFTNDPQFYQGLGAAMTSRLDRLYALGHPISKDMIPVIFAILGVGRTLKNNQDPESQSFLMRHYTAARAYSLQYFISSLLAGKIKERVAFGLWSWAFTRFDQNLNKELMSQLPGNNPKYKNHDL